MRARKGISIVLSSPELNDLRNIATFAQLETSMVQVVLKEGWRQVEMGKDLFEQERIYGTVRQILGSSRTRTKP